MPDIKVLYGPSGIGAEYARLMGQNQGRAVAAAVNTVGSDRNPDWVAQTGEDWPTYYVPVLTGPGVPSVTIEVSMDTVQGGKDFFESLADLEAALTGETLGWLDSQDRDVFRGNGFKFAINWTLRPAAGSVTDYDSRHTGGHYAATVK